jgi:hypothetical protein
MKIEDLRKKEDILKFCFLNTGDVFRVEPYGTESQTFMKIPRVRLNSYIDDCKEDNYNAVCLNDGILSWFDWNEDIIKVEAKVVIVK